MKKSKDLSVNPRPLNSFMLFKKSIKNEIMKNYAVQSSSDVSSIAGQIWKSMTSEDKQPFLDEYNVQLSIWTEKETKRLEKELKAGSPTATVQLAILCKKSKVAKKTNGLTNRSSPVKARRYSDSSIFSSNSPSDGSFDSPELSHFSPTAPLMPSAFMKELDELIASSGNRTEPIPPTLTSLSSTCRNESSTDSMISSTVFSDIDSSQDPSFFFSDSLEIKQQQQPINCNTPFFSFLDLLDQSTLFTSQQPSFYPSSSFQNYDYMNAWINPGLETKVDDKRLSTILEEEKQSLPCFATFCSTVDEVL